MGAREPIGPDVPLGQAWTHGRICKSVHPAVIRHSADASQCPLRAKERHQPRRLSSQHDPGDIFASVEIDHDEINLSSGPFAQFVEAIAR